MRASRVRLHEAGPELSRFVAGMMNLTAWGMTARERLDFLHAALELGLTSFDHADIYGGYGCEQAFGEALALEPALRDRIELISKCGIMLRAAARPANRIKHYDTSYAHIVASVERSLANLHTDHLDLLLLHRPDPLMDVDESARALTDLVRSGKVRHVGVSNFPPAQVALLASRLDLPLVTNQIEISVLHLEPFLDGTLADCQVRRIAPMAWSPLAGGRIFSGGGPREARLRAALQRVGGSHDATVDQVALAWLLRHPARILPLLGSGRVARLASAVAAESVDLSRQQWFEIWEASTGAEVP